MDILKHAYFVCDLPSCMQRADCKQICSINATIKSCFVVGCKDIAERLQSSWKSENYKDDLFLVVSYMTYHTSSLI